MRSRFMRAPWQDTRPYTARVSPAPGDVEALARKVAAMNYRPRRGFVLDQKGES